MALGSEGFKKKWGSLFLEFKNDKGYLSSQYYLIYFTRRVAYAFSQIYLNSFPFLQGGINIFCSLLTLAHLLYYKPFKDSAILASNIIGEVNITLVMGLIYVLLWDFDSWYEEKIERAIMFSVIISILLQIAISIYTFYKSMVLLWDKIIKIRALNFKMQFERMQKSSEDVRK